MAHIQQHDQHAPVHDSHQHQDAAADYGDLLDLDAEVLHDYWSAALDWIWNLTDDAPFVRVLDLGAGTGTGAFGLAQRFRDASDVVALDVSADSLARLRARALDHGLAARVRTVQADLDAGWPDLGVLDLTWASMSMHHMADPSRVLRDVFAATRSGGMIAVAEFSQPLRFLPDDLGFGRPGFEHRVTQTLDHAHTEMLPTLGSAWAPRLAEAGWEVTAERDFPIDLNPPEHPSATRYARAWFERLAQGLEDRLEPDDRTTLAALLDDGGPHSVLNRTDLHIRGIRSITIGNRDR